MNASTLISLAASWMVAGWTLIKLYDAYVRRPAKGLNK